MIFGKLDIQGDAVHTHRDTYFLNTVTNISARREFLGSGLMIAVATAGFGLAFKDILWPHEIFAIIAVVSTSLAIGLCIGKLQFLSRDLARSQQACVLFGTFPHLNRLRFEIADAAKAAQSSEPKS